MSHRRTKPAGAQRTYGILVGKIEDGKMAKDSITCGTICFRFKAWRRFLRRAPE
jgi:hypothetical protein